MKYKHKTIPVVIERQDEINGVNLAEFYKAQADLQTPKEIAAAVAHKADLIAANTRELRKQLEQQRIAHLEHAKGVSENEDLLKSLAGEIATLIKNNDDLQKKPVEQLDRTAESEGA